MWLHFNEYTFQMSSYEIFISYLVLIDSFVYWNIVHVIYTRLVIIVVIALWYIFVILIDQNVYVFKQDIPSKLVIMLE